MYYIYYREDIHVRVHCLTFPLLVMLRIGGLLYQFPLKLSAEDQNHPIIYHVANGAVPVQASG